MATDVVLPPQKRDFDDDVAGLIHGYLFSPDALPVRLNAREAVKLGRRCLTTAFSGCIST